MICLGLSADYLNTEVVSSMERLIRWGMCLISYTSDFITNRYPCDEETLVGCPAESV